MSNKVLLAKSAARDYQNLNEPFKSQIKEVLNKLEQMGTNAPNVKPLTGEFKGYYRIRTGDYRIVFSSGNESINIVSILHRKDAYKMK